MAIKVLISGYENTGKTTLISKIQNALVINCDSKEFSIDKVVYSDYKNYTGLQDFMQFTFDKIKLYKSKFNKFPKYIVFDTITHLYAKMIQFNSKKFKGFEIHSTNNLETMELNNFLEVIISKDINVIIVAHTKVDEKTGKHIIPSQGNFKDCGSFLSICNEAIFIERSLDNHLIHLKSNFLPVRSLYQWEQESIPFNEFNINDYLEKITQLKIETEKFRL